MAGIKYNSIRNDDQAKTALRQIVSGSHFVNLDPTIIKAIEICEKALDSGIHGNKYKPGVLDFIAFVQAAMTQGLHIDMFDNSSMQVFYRDHRQLPNSRVLRGRIQDGPLLINKFNPGAAEFKPTESLTNKFQFNASTPDFRPICLSAAKSEISGNESVKDCGYNSLSPLPTTTLGEKNIGWVWRLESFIPEDQETHQGKKAPLVSAHSKNLGSIIGSDVNPRKAGTFMEYVLKVNVLGRTLGDLWDEYDEGKRAEAGGNAEVSGQL